MSEPTIDPAMLPERLDLRSMPIADERIARLRETFPEVFREAKIDFDALKRSLGEWVEPGKERFGLNWPGKAECMRVIQAPSVGTLLPMRDESVDFDTTQNMIIEGDNLEVLKLLQKSYYGKVKMIYIDPPYNTGKEFLYPDNYTENLDTYLRYSGQIDAAGHKFSTNTESSGRFHSKWLSMMYPRLFLARNLLCDNGAILVSIGDNELASLISLMNELFGEENRIAIFVWRSRAKPTNAGDARFRPQRVAEYVLAYGRQPGDELRWNVVSSKKRAYPHEDGDGKFRTTTILTSNRGMFRRETMRFESGGYQPDEDSRWKAGKTIVDDLFARNRILFNDEGIPLEKKYEHEENDPLYPIYTFMDTDITGTAESGKTDLNELVGNQHGLDTVKPVQLMKYLCATFSSPGDIVFDFFAGSGTTAQAVLELNHEEPGPQRRFVLAQLPERYEPESEAAKSGLRTIADLCRKRVRAVANMLRSAGADELQFRATRDGGFRSYHLAASNFKVWDGATAASAPLAETLYQFAGNVLDGRTSEDVLCEILLKSGFELIAPAEKTLLAGKEVFSVADGAMLVCLDRELTLEVFEAMVERKPAQIICLDAGFRKNDQLKVNAVQTIKSRARSEESTIVLKVV